MTCTQDSSLLWPSPERGNTLGNRKVPFGRDIGEETSGDNSPFALEREGTYAEYTTPILTLPGDKAPLLISNSVDREMLQQLKGIEIGSTHLNQDLVQGLAIHIFNEGFRYNYNLFHRNAQAFVCFLLASIHMLESQREKPHKPNLTPCIQPTLTASLASYAIWKQITSQQTQQHSTLTFPSTPITSISWSKVVPPEIMRERLDLHPNWPQAIPRKPSHTPTPAMQPDNPPQNTTASASRPSRELPRNIRLVVDRAVVLPRQVSQQITQQIKAQSNLAGFVSRALGVLVPQIKA
ncbi:MAG: hypothetical protein Q9160_005283 [Pyrenula sp. 1 TL-2023]